MSARKFHICTVANRLDQYEVMRSSFESCGFDDSVCRYSLFDNSKENRYDPHAVITQACRESPEPYVISCHQDIRVDSDARPHRLLQLLEELESDHPSWAVAGDAGITAMGEFVACLTDPKGSHGAPTYPASVISLDENFLVIRRDAMLACSPGLTGFHLYAADLCLNALVKARTCHVIDFHVTHLSAGDAFSSAFNQSAREFAETWNKRMVLGTLETPTRTIFRLSRFPFVRKWLDDWSFLHRTRQLGYTLVPSARATNGRIPLLRDLGRLGAVLAHVAQAKTADRRARKLSGQAAKPKAIL